MLHPPRLEEEDTVAFVAPAGGLAALTPHRLERAKTWFEEQGFAVKVFDTATMNEEAHSAASVSKRVEDLMNAFKDDEVKAIVTTIGGTTANQLLPRLDYDVIRENPTMLCGYSDITNIHCALQTQAEMVSFYGPAVITQFGEWPEPHEYTVEEFFAATMNEKERCVEPSDEWTDDKTMDYIEGSDTGYHREYKSNPGYEWLREGRGEGQLVGGCLTSLMNLRGTKYFPSTENNILVLETPEGEDYRVGEDLARVEMWLSNLRLDGSFAEASGVVFGRGFGYDDEEHRLLKELIRNATKGCDMPVVYGVNVGHADPVTTLPLGTTACIDSSSNTIRVQPGVK